MPKSNVDQAVRAFINAKENGYSAPTDVISTEQVAVRLKTQAEVQAKIKAALEQPEKPVAAVTGEKIGEALGNTVNGIVRGAKSFFREVRSGASTFTKTVTHSTYSDEDTAKRVVRIIDHKLTETVNVHGHEFKFVAGELVEEGK